jgi:hypothetical protein
MKKAVVMCLLIMMVITIIVPAPVFAQYDKELENAIKVAKAKFDIPKIYDNFNYNISKQNSKTVFDLMWNDSKNRLGNISVSIDSSGKVTNYYSYKNQNPRSQKKLPAISKSDALKIASNFIRKVNPDMWSKIQYQENNRSFILGDNAYNFSYIRVEKKIPFPGNTVSVSVNGMTKEIQSFNCNWNEDVSFPDDKGAMTLENAQKTYMEKLGLKLVYKLAFEQDKTKPYLVYSNVYFNRYIDAVSGEVYSSENSYPYYGGAGGEGKMRSEAGPGTGENAVNLTPKEQEAVQSVANMLDQTKAENIARTTFKLDKSYKLNYVSMYSGWMTKDDYTWSMDFAKEENGVASSYSVNVSLDAKTGDILSYYKYLPEDTKAEVKYSEAQSLKIAEDFIKTLNPEKFKLVELTDWSQPNIRPLDSSIKPRQFDFTYTRKVNGAYFQNNGFGISINTVTGEITSYSFTWYKKELTVTEKVIALSQAYKVLFDNVGIQKQYIAWYPPEKLSKIIPPMPNETEKPEIRLVYAVKQEKPANIDAFSGKLITDEGKPFEPTSSVQYTDITGISAENQIKVLAEHGVSLPGTKLNPNKNITQREFLYLLQKSIYPYMDVKLNDSSENDTLYNELINAGIVKESEKSPNSAVTRQEAVKFMVRALNYDKVAEIQKGIFKLPFKDAQKIKNGLSGYVAIAYGLNIISDEKGYIKPTVKLTHAEAFAVLYNFLNVS